MANTPGIQYPFKGEDQDAVNRNIYDNLLLIRSALGDVQGHTLTLAKLTTNGKSGSITFNQYGIVTAFVDPT